MWLVLIVGSIIVCALTGVSPEKFLIGWAIVIAVYLVLKLIGVIVRAAREDKEKKDFGSGVLPSGKNDGKWYEERVADALRRGGYNVTVTPYSGDYGVDVIATKNGKRWAIQCKNFKKPVSLKAVQEVYAGKEHYGCHYAAVVTNNTFTQSARELAEETGVILMEKNDLSWIDRIEEYNAMM